jgi:hypothetical protein
MIFQVTCGTKDREWNEGESSLKHDQDVLMPGFRFHPTEEELLDFYLRRKVEGKHFNIELIAPVDLYRYDPWELPALAFTGEKEWFFYVQRDRKYRNGDRPNRVTTSGYWKATGADRMVRNEVSRCIGLKKSLVFYKGKAPKGKRTSWIMNEYRLPQLESRGIQKSELSLCRVYRKSGGSEEGHQHEKERHMIIENYDDHEMHQCQSCMACSNPRTTGESCNFEIREVGNDETVKLEELPTDTKLMPKPLTEEERFRPHMEYGVPDPMECEVPDQTENIQERIYSEGVNVWSTVCGPIALNEDLERSLTTYFMCLSAPDQLAMSDDLSNNNPSSLVLNNALTYGASSPTCSDKLWEWNPVRDEDNGASC